jgi:hypothetical protein
MLGLVDSENLADVNNLDDNDNIVDIIHISSNIPNAFSLVLLVRS